MRNKSWQSYTLLFLLVTMLVACKKDDESDSNLYMTGYLSAEVPEYLLVDQRLEIIAEGITLPTDSLTYTWYTKGFSVDSTFGPDIIITTPQTPGSYKISLFVSHPRYVTKNLIFYTTVIDPSSEESVGGIIKGDKIYRDQRDGYRYYYLTIANLDWFRFNLNWEGAGTTYKNQYALNDLYGRIYNWEEAQSACPQGWRVPTNRDWEVLAQALAGSEESISFDGKWAGLGSAAAAKGTLNSKSMWKYSPNIEFLNIIGWNALPSGNYTGNGRTFINRSEFGMWWSADEKDSNNAYYRYIHFDAADFPYNYADKRGFGASVRCVRDSSVD